MFLSVVTASELLHGVHRSVGARRSRRSAFVEAILGAVPALPIDVEVARAHARAWADLAARGRAIGAHDLWIAATALARGLAVLTANKREFARVPGLTVRLWRADA